MSLSKREKEVMSLVCRKYSESANILYLSSSTIQGYYARLIEKYDCNNRFELFFKLFERGENDIIDLGDFTNGGRFRHRKYKVKLERID